MKTYLRTFVNYEQNNWAKLLPMAEFAYNNAKNASTGNTYFKLNCGYHLCVSYKRNIDLGSKSKSASKLLTELQKPMSVYKENFYYT